MLLIIAYLAAVVIANLTVAAFGAGISIVNAFLFIGLDLTARDTLHERWQGRNLTRNMALLILTGSVLSALLNINALPIAIASCVAFAAVGVVDTLVYALIRDRTRFIRVNGSNVVSAMVDSFLFPVLAFGAFLPAIFIGQWIAKIAGGFIWSWILFNSEPDDDDPKNWG